MHLSDYMLSHALSDEAVAAAIGKSRATVSRLRRRKMRPGWETLNRLKKYTAGKVLANDFIEPEQKAS